MTSKPDFLQISKAVPEIQKPSPETPIGMAVKEANRFLNNRWDRETGTLKISLRDLANNETQPLKPNHDLIQVTRHCISGILNAYELANISRQSPENEAILYRKEALFAVGKLIATGNNSFSSVDREQAKIIQNALEAEIGKNHSDELVLQSQINLALDSEPSNTFRDLQNNKLELVVDDQVLNNGGLVIQRDQSTDAVLHSTYEIRDLLKKSMGETAYYRLEKSGLINNNESLTLALKNAINHQIEKRGIGSVEDKKSAILQDSLLSVYIFPFATVFSSACIAYGMILISSHSESALDNLGSLTTGSAIVFLGSAVAITYGRIGGKKLVDSFREFRSLTR